MKQITLKSVYVREIRFRPNDSEPNIALYYDVLDSEGNTVGSKDFHIKTSVLPQKALTALTSYLSNLSEMVSDRELK